ncbi:hypothetical protein [Alloalcanivorax venustensis]|jgi:hypothetical protein|uniref:hypothetical protein n=1 Tax=Alloalcanivorax venustensis TaxID=172371 RepID=UPI0039E46237|nr:hypothetical protein [Alcanivorax sp.]
MSMEMMKKVLVGAIGVAIYSFSGSAQAACNTTTADQWECLQAETSAGSGTYTDLTSATTMSGPYTFEGVSDLSYSVFGIPVLTAQCIVTLEGEVDVDPTANRAYLEVTSGAVSQDPAAPDSDCDDITISSFVWYFEDPNDGQLGIDGANGGDVHLPATDFAVGDIDEMKVSHSSFGQICSGPLEGVEFRNGSPVSEPSSFDFAASVGNCNINGMVTTDGYVDVNAW